MARAKSKTKTKPKAKSKPAKAGKVAPKKRGKATVTPSKPAVAARKRRKREAAAVKESVRASERAGKRAPKIDKREQAKRRIERARKTKKARQRQAQRRAPRDVRDQLRDALDTMRTYANAVSPCELAIETPDSGTRTLWIMVGVFGFLEGVTWTEISTILDDWANDYGLSVQIHPNRLSQIRAAYEPANGKAAWASMSSIGPWDLVVSDAAQRVDPDDKDSWSSKYKGAAVGHLEVYFSASLATQSEIAL